MTKLNHAPLIALVFLVIAPTVAYAQTWTGDPAAAVVDEQSIGIYDADTGTLKYNNSGSTSTIIARYNVTDTTGKGAPGWTTIELGAYDNSPNSEVAVTLFRNSPTGSLSNIGGCWSTDSSVLTRSTCPILGSINFNSGHTYVLVITISRASAALTPMFTGVRLY